MAASTPEAGAGAGAEGVEQEQSTFDIFVQSIDLRWCLLLHCDYASLTAIRQLCSAFLQHVPFVLNSKEWGASANSVALHAAQWAAGGDDDVLPRLQRLEARVEEQIKNVMKEEL